ncbi:UNVERIFIED_CONTAM: protein YLS3 [Sesamum radiatum]|uniref:Protein YLS3 n=1 Tax=Sesamum radiatum TaxID=300843 RepID=A0AAW2VJC6_SESRA
MFSALATSDTSKDREECAESLVGLATCLPYVGGTAKAPTPDCCTALKHLLNTKKKCLCVIIKDRNDPDLGLNINVTLALGLPQVCNAPANISQCPALLNLPPDSPDAQIFSQFGQKSSNSSSSSPVAIGPNANGTSNSGTNTQQSSSSDNGKSCLGLEILIGVVLSWAFTINLIS